MSQPTYACHKHGYPLGGPRDACPICREEVEDEYGDSLDRYLNEDDEDRDDRYSEDGDCMNCGMCEDCIERTMAASEER
jgi:hypothetical protein